MIIPSVDMSNNYAKKTKKTLTLARQLMNICFTDYLINTQRHSVGFDCLSKIAGNYQDFILLSALYYLIKEIMYVAIFVFSSIFAVINNMSWTFL